MLDNITKSDLKTGMRVTTRNGRKLLVLKNFKHLYDESSEVLVGIGSASWFKLDYINEDLTATYDIDDIVKVEIPYHYYNVTKNEPEADEEFNYQVLWLRDLTI